MPPGITSFLLRVPRRAGAGRIHGTRRAWRDTLDHLGSAVSFSAANRRGTHAGCQQVAAPGGAGGRRWRRGLDGGADRAEDRLDLAAQEDERDDRDDRDEGEDEGVLGEALALLVAVKRRDDVRDERHVPVSLR